MDRLFIIMPAYNEEAVIREVVEAWYAIVEEHHGDGDSRLVVINDGSTDRTQEILDGMQEDRPLLHVINKVNGGHGDALLTGYRCAVENHADYVFQTDSDGQTLPEEFEAFWRKRERFDLIIGNRKQRKDGRGRVLVAHTERLMIMYLFHVNLADANTPFRLMNGAWLAKSLPLVPQGFFLVNILLSVIAAKQKRRILYIPITFGQRAGGENSMNMKRIFRAGASALRSFPRMNRKIERELKVKKK
ncbi:MAG: glycosyltransferase family 2 protein [Eubacterium sp.]|nr:glycosyltransferase family 2 protein [Eubacterium sp.]